MPGSFWAELALSETLAACMGPAAGSLLATAIV
jgi:hypothetical protein